MIYGFLEVCVSRNPVRIAGRVGVRALPWLIFSSACAQGGPPLITDDPGTPGANNWEINLSLAMEQKANAREFETPLLDVNYGVGERLQLKFEIPWVVVDEEGSGTQNGLGNFEIGVKWRFLDEDQSGVNMSIYPQLTFNNPTSSDNRGLVDEGIEFFFPVEIARSVGIVELGFEAGYAFVEQGEDEWAFGFVVAYPLSDSLELLGELHEIAARDFGNDEGIVNLGFTYQFTEHVGLLGSAGTALWSSTGERTEVLAFLGLQFAFGQTSGEQTRNLICCNYL
jgi:hypothetical protein